MWFMPRILEHELSERILVSCQVSLGPFGILPPTNGRHVFCAPCRTCSGTPPSASARCARNTWKNEASTSRFYTFFGLANHMARKLWVSYPILGLTWFRRLIGGGYPIKNPWTSPENAWFYKTKVSWNSDLSPPVVETNSIGLAIFQVMNSRSLTLGHVMHFSTPILLISWWSSSYLYYTSL